MRVLSTILVAFLTYASSALSQEESVSIGKGESACTARPYPPPPPPKYPSCGGFRVDPKPCPEGTICIDDPYSNGCGMACDMPGTNNITVGRKPTNGHHRHLCRTCFLWWIRSDQVQGREEVRRSRVSGPPCGIEILESLPCLSFRHYGISSDPCHTLSEL
jgi:hypothetical protein